MRPDRDTEFTDYMSARMPALRRLARLLRQDWSRADDLLQAAMTRTYLHWSKAARADNTDAYVRAILVRQFVDDRRANWTRRVRLTDQPMETVAPDNDQECALDLRTAVTALPPRQRAVLVLRYFCDLNVDQAADALGCSPGTVKSQTARGLAALRQAMGSSLSLWPSYLSCGKTSWGPLDGRAGTIDGFPAYWMASSSLFVEWARDRWAEVQFPTRQDDLLVVRHLTDHAPAIRYPFQLTGSWPGVGVQSVSAGFAHGRGLAGGITLAPVAKLNPPVTVPFRDIAQVDVGPVGSTPACISSGTHEVINGYHVDVAWIDRYGADPIQDVCASDADGLLVRSHSYGTRLFASAPVVFAHLKMFGPDPAKWPATPFG